MQNTEQLWSRTRKLFSKICSFNLSSMKQQNHEGHKKWGVLHAGLHTAKFRLACFQRSPGRSGSCARRGVTVQNQAADPQSSGHQAHHSADSPKEAVPWRQKWAGWATEPGNSAIVACLCFHATDDIGCPTIAWLVAGTCLAVAIDMDITELWHWVSVLRTVPIRGELSLPLFMSPLETKGALH